MVMMDKLFEYYRRMWVELAAVAAFGMVALTLALRGWGVWSLIWGYVAQELVVAAGCAALCSFRPRLAFDRRIAGQLFSFGKHVLGSGAINFLIYQGDRALISRLLGKAPLGYYAESYKWGSQPIFQASSILARVTYPAFTRLQDKPDGLRDAFMRIYFFISWLALPFFVGIWFLAPELATVIFGRRWDPAVMVPLLRVVAFYGMARAMLSPAGALFQAVGRPHYLSRITVVRLAIIVVAIYPVTRIWGLLGTAWVVTGSLLAVAPVFYLLAGRILQRSVFQILLHLRAALLSSTVMGAVLWALARMTAIDGHWGLLARVLAGAAVYAAVLWVVSPASRGQLRDMVGTFFE
jgi:O-antigen/teichoic acid export membrane protein